jgi:hypothetical protein
VFRAARDLWRKVRQQRKDAEARVEEMKVMSDFDNGLQTLIAENEHKVDKAELVAALRRAADKLEQGDARNDPQGQRQSQGGQSQGQPGQPPRK